MRDEEGDDGDLAYDRDLQEWPQRGRKILLLEAGTVLNAKDARKAIQAGAKFLMSPVSVKVYPISALGGAQYISAIKKPFSHVPMVASQGITIDLLETYIIQGASAVVLSDAIFSKEAMNQSNFDAIQQLAYLSALRGGEAVERKRGKNHLHVV
ncbi:hypothetical protein MRB53_009838 [Persea americana]|uniref:Uncharacterized protein n=1 Tax=Persea americana TaxID=3435 RepID=A0ACC2LRB3_PERAE|nr:hypothetical protein MRB53_009838 [Persea americana]